MSAEATIQPVYVKTYTAVKFLPKGLYRIADQDKSNATLVLEHLDGCRFLRKVTCEAFTMMLHNRWADLSLTPTRL